MTICTSLGNSVPAKNMDAREAGAEEYLEVGLNKQLEQVKCIHAAF